ncbi:MAG: hypothetical protein AAGB93_00710 [Planctomycetota bacterium]
MRLVFSPVDALLFGFWFAAGWVVLALLLLAVGLGCLSVARRVRAALRRSKCQRWAQ